MLIFFKMADMKVKKDSVCRWKRDATKAEKLLDVFISYKRQKLGGGVEWDSDKVVLFKHVRSALAEKWPEDFGKSEPSTPEKQPCSQVIRNRGSYCH